MHRPFLSAALVGLTTAACLAASFAVTGPASSSADQHISIRVELDLPNAAGSGPRALEVTDVMPGPGAELTTSDEVSNPSMWCGTVSVDLDPSAKTITVAQDAASNEAPCDFETVAVTVTSPGLTGISRVSGDLLVDAADPVTRTAAPVAGGVAMTWTTAPDEPLLLGGSEMFAYSTTTTPPPTTPASPSTSPTPTSPGTSPAPTSPSASSTTPTVAPTATAQPLPTAFVPLVKPILKGRALIGRSLRVRNVSPGNFVPRASNVSIRWFRAGTRIRGARDLSYTVVSADLGKRLKARITIRGAAPTTTIVLRSAKIERPNHSGDAMGR